jgi:hypothetical protein
MNSNMKPVRSPGSEIKGEGGDGENRYANRAEIAIYTNVLSYQQMIYALSQTEKATRRGGSDGPTRMYTDPAVCVSWRARQLPRRVLDRPKNPFVTLP